MLDVNGARLKAWITELSAVGTQRAGSADLRVRSTPQTQAVPGPPSRQCSLAPQSHRSSAVLHALTPAELKRPAADSEVRAPDAFSAAQPHGF
jgi:hypothetical protein